MKMSKKKKINSDSFHPKVRVHRISQTVSQIILNCGNTRKNDWKLRAKINGVPTLKFLVCPKHHKMKK